MTPKLLLILLALILATVFVASDFGSSFTGSSVAVAQKKKRQGVFERLFRPRDQSPELGSSRTIPPRALSPRGSSPTKRRVPQASGVRTLCVRTCDGYYFPISSSTSRKRFKIDEAVCKAMYAGAEANLFVHNNGSPADTAVSLTGKPLAREPNAFAFRHTFSEPCQAELKNGLSLLAAAFAAKAAQQSTASVEGQGSGDRLPPNPVSRVVAGIDPETVSNRAGRFTVAPVLPAEDAAIAAASQMRKLGPDYYYDPVVIEGLRAPPPRGPEFTLIGSVLAGERDKEWLADSTLK